MSKIYQKIELMVNILIIVVAALLVGILIQKYFFSGSPMVSGIKSPIIGAKVQIADIDWPKSNKNVLLVLSKGCRYCTESAEFYKKLIQQTQGKNVQITAVLPQAKEEAEKYLSELGIPGVEIRQSQLDSLNVGGTPTIIVADDKGVISDVWIGKLSSNEETEVVNKLTITM